MSSDQKSRFDPFGDLGMMLAIVTLVFASFEMNASRNVELPRGGADGNAEPPAVLIEIGAGGEHRVDGQAIAAADLVRTVASLADSGAVVWVAADSAAPTGISFLTYALLEDAHFAVRAVFGQEEPHDHTR